MNIDSESLKNFIIQTIRLFRRTEHELMAHALVFAGLKKTLGMEKELETLLDEARNSPELHQNLAEKYDKPLEKFVATIDEAELDRQVLDFLEKWKPDGGRPN